MFVTTDPARDTPEKLQTWLANFDPSFIGLRGTPEQVKAIEKSVGVAPAVAGAPDSSGSYEVGHAAQVIAFTPDDSAHVVYPFGTRQADWAHDLAAARAGEMTHERAVVVFGARTSVAVALAGVSRRLDRGARTRRRVRAVVEAARGQRARIGRSSAGRRIGGWVAVVLVWMALDWPGGPLGTGYLASVHAAQFLVLGDARAAVAAARHRSAIVLRALIERNGLAAKIIRARHEAAAGHDRVHARDARDAHTGCRRSADAHAARRVCARQSRGFSPDSRFGGRS